MTDKESGTNFISTGGSVMPLTAQGWDSFGKTNEESQLTTKTLEQGLAIRY